MRQTTMANAATIERKWVGLINNIKACAEKIVLKESVYM